MEKEGNPKTISDKPMAEMDLRLALDMFRMGIMRDIQVCFPACIYSYDRATHTATVMPLVKQAYFNGQWHYMKRQFIRDVTVRNIQCGGFTIDFPVYVGDTGWVIASDRDTQNIKQFGTLTTAVLEKGRSLPIIEDDYQQKPNQLTLQSFANGFFIPDNWGLWETHRFKDNPHSSIGTSLYIGSSIDTDDERDDDANKTYQKGDAYEKKTTCSLSMQSNGGISLASSTRTKPEKEGDPDPPKKHVALSIAEKAAGFTATNEEAMATASMSLDADDGILIRYNIDTEEDKEKNLKKKKQSFLCALNNGMFSLRLVDSTDEDNPPKMISFCFADGKLNMMASDDLNLNIGGTANIKAEKGINVFSNGTANVTAMEGVNVKAEKDAFVSASNARVTAKKDATVAAKNVSASATGDVKIAAGARLEVGAVKETTINGGERVSIVGGKKVEVSATEVTVKSKNAGVMVEDGAVIETKKFLQLVSNKIELFGKVAISGELDLNGDGFEAASSGNPKVWLVN